MTGQRVSDVQLETWDNYRQSPAIDWADVAEALIADLRAAREETRQLQERIEEQNRDRVRLDARITQQRVSLAAENDRRQRLEVKIRKAMDALCGGSSD